MQKEINFRPFQIAHAKGHNQKVPILAIQDKTYQYVFLESMGDCFKKLGVPVREVSRITLHNPYTCSKGWTFIRCSGDTNPLTEISNFIEARSKLDISILPKNRVCDKCHTEYPLNEVYFHKNKPSSKYSKFWFKSTCKTCRKGDHKEKYISYKAKIESDHEYRASHLIKIYKRLDSLYGRTFGLTKEWIVENIIGRDCVYCDSNEFIGVERIDNSLGHLMDNCLPCCKICNVMRMNNFTHKEFYIIGQAVKQIVNNRKKHNGTK